MTEEEKKQEFEEDIVKMAVAEYYKFVDDCNKAKPKSKVRSEKESEVFYYAMRLGVRRGMNFMAHQYQELLIKQKEKGNEADDR